MEYMQMALKSCKQAEFDVLHLIIGEMCFKCRTACFTITRPYYLKLKYARFNKISNYYYTL